MKENIGHILKTEIANALKKTKEWKYSSLNYMQVVMLRKGVNLYRVAKEIII